MVEEEPGQKDEEVGREDTLLRKKLVRLTIALGAVLAVALLVSLGFALRWYLSPQTDLSISQRQALVQGLASAGQALAVLLTGAVGLIGLYLTRQNTNKQLRQARESTQEQLQQARESQERQLQQARESQERTQASAQETLRLTEQGQITDRFTRAIDQLGATDDKTGAPRLEIRIGGFYALERIAKDSPERAYSAVMEVLTAYARKNSPLSKEPQNNQQDMEHSPQELPADIRAIVDVLRRREAHRVPKEQQVRLDLHRTNLSGANLSEANLSGANLSEASLSGANLHEAILDESDLSGANLTQAHLLRANLEGATLYEVNLDRANLYGANLKKTNLGGKVNLYAATLNKANLEGAIQLRQEELEKAIGDDTTVLPDDNDRPGSWH